MQLINYIDEWVFEMNLHALRIFVEVGKLGSVTKAAEQLLISQPAITAQLRKLEQETRLRLVEPEGRGIKLTAYGELLYAQAVRLFAHEREIEQLIAKLQEGEQGRLRIGATLFPANYLVPGWVAQFKKEHPHVDIEMHTGNSRLVFDQLLRGEVELALMAGGWEEAGIKRRVIGGDELWFIVPAGHELAGTCTTIERLMREPFLFREQGSSTRNMLLSLCAAHRVEPPQAGLMFQGIHEGLQAVIAGYGAMLVPSMAAREPIAAGKVARVCVEGVSMERPITLCVRKGEEASPAAARFIRMLEQVLAEETSVSPQLSIDENVQSK
ncbi:UNVERIFIED_CONTAM: DNA-binding transcriptional LysR family regulator [Brevibacillus sp. OAP136]